MIMPKNIDNSSKIKNEFLIPDFVTAKPQKPNFTGEWAWSRSWSLSPNGDLEVKKWNSEKSLKTETHSLKTTLTPIDLTQTSSLSNLHLKEIKTLTKEEQKTSDIPKTKKPTKLLAVFKPHAIETAHLPYKGTLNKNFQFLKNLNLIKILLGPTFNCRVLNAAVDGQPSKYTDSSCKLLLPGIVNNLKKKPFAFIDKKSQLKLKKIKIKLVKSLEFKYKIIFFKIKFLRYMILFCLKV